MFELEGDPVDIVDVDALNSQKQLNWTRHDVRNLMQKSVKKGVPMDVLPVWSPSLLDRVFDGLSAVADAGEQSSDVATYGQLSPTMVCPHCQSSGRVRTKQVKQKKGVSGGKATAAVVTAGLSVLVTGLSRKELATQAHCMKCGSTWHF